MGGLVGLLKIGPISSRLFQQLICVSLIFLLSLGLGGSTKKTQAIKVPIFGFHDIVDLADVNDAPPYRKKIESDYTKQDLYPFLNYLVDHHYWFLSTQDLYTYFIKKSQPIPDEYLNRKPVMITFDDGYYSIRKNVLPILKDLDRNYGETVKIALFVNSKYVGSKIKGHLPHLSCEELQEGYRAGFYDIQSHGHGHRKFTRLRLKSLKTDLAIAKDELRKCMQELDTKAWTASHIAYPFGAISRRVEKYLPEYYLTGYLYDDVISRPNKLRNPYRISRIRVNRSLSPRQLIKLAEKATVIQSASI